MNSGDAVLVYTFGGTVLSYVICNVVVPYPKTNNIFEIYDVPDLRNYRTNHH
jgi:hypothetical protein